MTNERKTTKTPTTKGPECRYANLFQFASIQVPYLPIFHSWQKASSAKGEPHQPPEYQWDEVSVKISPGDFRLPREFSVNAVPEPFQKRLDAGQPVDPCGKCRFVGYHADFTPVGSEDRLTIDLQRTDYLDYLRSGECLDRPLPTDPSRTFRDKYAPHIQSLRGFAEWKLSNICGVGIFLITSDAKIIVSRHSGDVAVFPDVLSYSASGTMDWNRIDQPFLGHPNSNPGWLRFLNPFAQIARETLEELAHQIDPEGTRLFGLGVDAKKLYFQFSFLEETRRTSQEILAKARSARDFFKEMADVKAIDFDLSTIAPVLKTENWEPAAKAALLSLCAREFGIETVERALDPEFVSARWERNMRTEWSKRAQRDGDAAVMSTRYSPHRLSDESRKYVNAVITFLGEDIVGKDVVEIGSGIGRLTERLVSAAQRLTCVEFSGDMILRSRARLGGAAKRVKYLCNFGQNYVPQVKHDVAICSLVMVHNVEDLEFQKLATAVAGSADTVFLFEHVDEPYTPHPHTRIRSARELIAAFPDFEVERRSTFSLFSDQIVFLKLRRRTTPKSKHVSTVHSEQRRMPSQPHGLPDRVSGIPRKAPVPANAKARVFVSHSSKDKPFVRQLVQGMRRHNLNVWFDEQEIKVGDSIVARISEGLRDSDYLVVVLSKTSVASRWVQEELNLALMEQISGKGTAILPILIEDCVIPPLLRTRLYADFRADFNAGFSKLLAVLEQEGRSAAQVTPSAVRLTAAPCSTTLSALPLADLRRRMTKRMDRVEVGAIWFDVLGKKMDDDMSNRPLVDCVIELLDRGKNRNKLSDIIDGVCADRPDLAKL